MGGRGGCNVTATRNKVAKSNPLNSGYVFVGLGKSKSVVNRFLSLEMSRHSVAPGVAVIYLNIYLPTNFLFLKKKTKQTKKSNNDLKNNFKRLITLLMFTDRLK